jgi:bifunctional DNA-binding transcriptional regulator/antitoxin component of YhaV-PrlF toxin-antitoxin module
MSKMIKKTLFAGSGTIHIPAKFRKALDIDIYFDEIILTLENDQIILTKGESTLDNEKIVRRSQQK